MENSSVPIYKNRMMILANAVVLTFMTNLDASIINVALPKMAENLAVSTETIAWTVTSYLLVIVSSILFFGRLGDLIGKSKVFLAGILVFSVGSLLCGLSTDLLSLLLARCVQGLGAGASMSTIQGIITQVFPANERGQALGLTGSAVALGAMTGPPLGGFIVSYFGWPYIFLINIPVGLFAFAVGLKVMPRDGSLRSEVKLDYIGTLLFILAIAPFFLALTLAEQLGYKHPLVSGGLLLSVLSFIAFVFFERRAEEPLLNLSLFADRDFSFGAFCSFLSFMAITGNTIILPFYLQYTLGYTPLVSGLIWMTSPVVLGIVAPISGRLSDKIGSEFLTMLGLALSSCGLFLLATLREGDAWGQVVTFLILMTMGNAIFQSPNTSLIMAHAPKNMLGVAGSVNALVRNVGMISGVTLSILILYNRMSAYAGYPVSDYLPGRHEVFLYGMQWVYVLSGGVCLLGAVLTAWRFL